MIGHLLQTKTSKAIKADQIKTFYAEFGTLNLAGALVFSLILIATYQFASVWKILPALLMVYSATIMRAYHIRQFRRAPNLKSPDQWGNLQTRYAALSGSGWGIGYALLLPALPLEYQFLIFVVTTVSSAATISAGFSYLWPSRVFTITALLPQMLWLIIVGDKFHTVFFFLLMIFLATALWQSFRRNKIFKDAVGLRLQNEQLIKELVQQHDLVEQASRDKTRFLASASHDLRQPLSALVLFLDLLSSDRQMSSQSQNMVLRANQAANSLGGLLTALLDISKLDASIVKPNRHSFAIHLLLNELESEFLPLAQSKGIDLSFAFSSALINSDPVLLGQILRNLISNALRYTVTGRILVGCRHRWGMLCIEVHDTGIGIPEDQHQVIFTEFYQIGNKERDRQKGLGLGLAIVKRTAQLLGHSVTMHSRQGKGSSFVITVPMASDFTYEVPVSFKPKTDQVKLNAVGQRIAVIENEEDIRIGLQTVLQSWGCNVVAANSIETILSMLEHDEEPVTAIISDYSLSDSSNGIDAIIALRQRYDTTLPAILITGDTTRETYMAAQEANLPLLYKPVEIEVLHNALARVMQTS